ncbi:MAG: hypothetical protein ACN6OR_01240 [Stenotrophomonas sp.]|uniref:hypothetical protein n=1 Tax=Stenotrophomonas sp. TaxID=69392 RepID=UPI0028A6A114|nr:hypothetical protein [Stenotrophomonas sp.]
MSTSKRPFNGVGRAGLAALLLATAGCANFTPLASKRTLDDGSTWLTYDSSRRGTIIIPATSAGKYRFCAEPSPDVALVLASKLKASGKATKGAEAGTEMDMSASAMELAGRNHSVLLARDAMFRLCEASLNNAFSSTEYLELFNQILQMTTSIATADAENAKARVALATSLKEQLQRMPALSEQTPAETKMIQDTLESLKSIR